MRPQAPARAAMPGERHGAFDSSHPSVPLAYFCGMAGLTMLCMHPVLVTLSLAGALLLSSLERGVDATLRGLRWQLPTVALIAAANPLFSASGSTCLARLGFLAIYLESVCYGACAAGMLVASVTWLECATSVVTQDGLLALLARRLGVVALMVSMAARLVPVLVRRGREISDVERVVTGSTPGSWRERVADAGRVSGALVGWSLSDSLDCADSMRARGWGAVRDRTSYQPWPFRPRDAHALVGIVALVLACALLAWVACSQYRFYPTMSLLVPWWGYVPYAVLALLPSACHLREVLAWRD